jgi:hypothetical protein
MASFSAVRADRALAQDLVSHRVDDLSGEIRTNDDVHVDRGGAGRRVAVGIGGGRRRSRLRRCRHAQWQKPAKHPRGQNALGQQNLTYVESLNPLESVEAHTEKLDGRKIMVEQSHILTRDAATGLNAVYQRDAKVETLNETLQMPLSGARDIPIGMPVHGRPGMVLLGQRVAGRQTDFYCYAGKQVGRSS